MIYNDHYNQAMELVKGLDVAGLDEAEKIRAATLYMHAAMFTAAMDDQVFGDRSAAENVPRDYSRIESQIGEYIEFLRLRPKASAMRDVVADELQRIVDGAPRSWQDDEEPTVTGLAAIVAGGGDE